MLPHSQASALLHPCAEYWRRVLTVLILRHLQTRFCLSYHSHDAINGLLLDEETGKNYVKKLDKTWVPLMCTLSTVV